MSRRRDSGDVSAEWRPVPGFEGLYEVADNGCVRSVDRVLPDGRTAGGMPLRPYPDSHGYLRVTLRSQAGARTYGVHTLVAAAFLGPRPKGRQIRHWDGDKINNRARNLRYGTQKQNERDKRRNRRRKKGETGETGRGTSRASSVVAPVAGGR